MLIHTAIATREPDREKYLNFVCGRIKPNIYMHWLANLNVCNFEVTLLLDLMKMFLVG